MKNESLKQAEEAVAGAKRLVHAQEEEVARMRLAGMSAARAKVLLSAYREGVGLDIGTVASLQTHNGGS